MILGIGNDLVDIHRIEDSLKRFGERFEKRVFTKNEQNYARRRKNGDIEAMAAIYAKRFAAKEACYKALGALHNGISWLDMEVVNDKNRTPQMKLYGNALKQLEKIIPPGSKAKIFLTMADEYPYAQAYVVIDSIPL